MTPVSLAELWLPILVTGLVTHVLSFLAWVVLPHHKPEWKHLKFAPVDDAITPLGAKSGEQYVLTAGEEGDLDPAKCRGTLILWGHAPSMGKNIGMTLAFFFAVTTVIAYLTTIALPKEAAPIDVFRFTATAALLCHCLGGMPHVIWFRRKILLDVVDGLAYSLATGAAFALLWPR